MNKLTLLFIIPLFTAWPAAAQDNPKPVELSLAQAVQLARNNNAQVKNSRLDLESARARRSEIRGIGFPQLSASFDVKNYIELPTQLLPGEIIGQAPGTFFPVQFGTRYNATAGISFSQIIFSGEYLVGLEASRSFLELSEKLVESSDIDVTVAVTKAYYNAIITRKRLGIVDANEARLKKITRDTRVMYETGFVEKIDADRLEVAYNNLLAERQKFSRLVGLTETLLKFQLGMDLTTPIILTDTLLTDVVSDVPPDTATNASVRVEVQMMEKQKKLHELDLKRTRFSYLPAVVGYGSLIGNAQRNEFNIFNDGRWFPIGVIGATVSVPVFDGFQKHYRSRQIQLSIQKSQNSIEHLKQALLLESTASYIAYQNAITTLQTQKKNMELAEGVYDISRKKFEQGVGSSLEVVTAEAALKEAQANYYTSLYEYYLARVDLQKARGEIK